MLPMATISSASRRSKRLGRAAVITAALLAVMLLSEGAIWCYRHAGGTSDGDVSLDDVATSRRDAGHGLVSPAAPSLMAQDAASPVVTELSRSKGEAYPGRNVKHARPKASLPLRNHAAKLGDHVGQSPAADPAAPDSTDEPGFPDRTVMWKAGVMVLRELGQPVSVPLDGEAYPDRRVNLEVTAADGTCRLVVDRGSVLVDGHPLRAGESCVVRLGAEVTWEGTAGIRLEDPRKVDHLQGPG